MARETYESIKKKISRLEARAKAMEAASLEKKSKAVAQVRALMKKLGVEPKDLNMAGAEKTGRGRKRGTARAAGARTAAKGTVPPKYRDPATGTTWSGRGRTPVWLAKYIEQGKSKDDFAIAAPAAQG